MDAYKSRQVSLCIAKHCRGEREKENSGFLLLFTRILLIAPSCLFKGMVRLSPYCRFRKTGFLNSWPFNNVSLLPVSLALSF